MIFLSKSTKIFSLIPGVPPRSRSCQLSQLHPDPADAVALAAQGARLQGPCCSDAPVQGAPFCCLRMLNLVCHIWSHISIHHTICVYTYIYTYIYICIFTCIYIYIRTSLYIFSIYIYLSYIYVYVYMYMYCRHISQNKSKHMVQKYQFDFAMPSPIPG